MLAGLLPHLDSVAGGPDERLRDLIVVASGKHVAIVQVWSSTVSHIWTYDRAAGTAQLTYRSE